MKYNLSHYGRPVLYILCSKYESGLHVLSTFSDENEYLEYSRMPLFSKYDFGVWKIKYKGV